MALSKRRCVEEAKARVREKLADIDEQRDIIVSFIDDIVKKAHVAGEKLLEKKDRRHFSKQHCEVMTELESARNQLFFIRTSLPSEEETDGSDSGSDTSSTKETDYSLQTPATISTTHSPGPPSSKTHPTPSKTHPTPIKTHPTPNKTQPTPTKTYPTPIKTQPTPCKTLLTPETGGGDIDTAIKEPVVEKVEVSEKIEQRKDVTETSSILQQTINTLSQYKDAVSTVSKKSNEQDESIKSEPEPVQTSVQKLDWPTQEKQQTGSKKPDQPLYKPSNTSSDSSNGNSKNTTKSKNRKSRKNGKTDKDNESSNSGSANSTNNAKPAATETVKEKNPELAVTENVIVKPLDLGRTGRTGFDVYVLLIESPKLLWLQPQSPKLDDMQEYLNYYYNDKLTAAEHAALAVTCPKAGMYCCTRYSADNTWYRVRIVQVIEKPAASDSSKKLLVTEQWVTVLYIDFGNKEEVRLSALRKLLDRFTTLPAHAIPCALAHVAPSGGGWRWPSEVTMVLGKQTLDKGNVFATLSSLPQCPIVSVELFKPEKEHPQHGQPASIQDMVDIGRLLLVDGLARPVDAIALAQELERMVAAPPAFNPVVRSELSRAEVLRGQRPVLEDDGEEGEGEGEGVKSEALEGEMKKMGMKSEREKFRREMTKVKGEKSEGEKSGRKVEEKKFEDKAPEEKLEWEKSERQMKKLEVRSEGEKMKDEEMKFKDKPKEKLQDKPNKNQIKDQGKDKVEDKLMDKLRHKSKDKLHKPDVKPEEKVQDKFLKDNIEDKFEGKPVCSPPHIQRQTVIGKTPVVETTTKEALKANLPKKSPKEVIKEAQEHIKLSENIKSLTKLDTEAGISKSLSHDQSVVASYSPKPKPTKTDAKVPVSHSTPKLTPKYIPKSKIFPTDPTESSSRKDQDGWKSGSTSRRVSLEPENKPVDLKTENPELSQDPKVSAGDPEGHDLVSNDDVKSGKEFSSTSETSSGSSWSSGWKNTVCDSEFERDLEKDTELLKAVHQKQAEEVSDTTSTSPSLPPPSTTSALSVTSAPPSITSASVDESNLDVSLSSTSNSAKKLKSLGLPKNLPKSCAFSAKYQELMASDDDGEGVGEESEANSKEAESMPELPIGEYEPVTVTAEEDGCLRFMFSHIESPGKFWIHPVSENTGVIVEGLMNGLQEYMQDNPKQPLSHLKGACAAIFSEDERFYRARIIDVERTEQQTRVRVFYVDFGNVEWLGAEQVFYLPPQFLELPPQAVPCCLVDVKPQSNSDNDSEEPKSQLAPNNQETKPTYPGNNETKEEGLEKTVKVEDWGSKAIEAFQEACPFDKVFVALVMSDETMDTTQPIALEEDKCLPVLVTDTSGAQNQWISLDLVQQGLVLPVDAEKLFPTEAKTIKEQQIKERLSAWDPMTADYLSIRNSYQVDIDDPGVAALGYKATDERRICRFYNMRKGCHAGENCPYLHIKYKDQALITADQREVFALDHQVEAPQEGAWVAIEITTFFTPAHFYAIFPFGTKHIIDAITDTDAGDVEEYGGGKLTNAEALEQLMEDLTEHYGSMGLPDSDLIIRAAGEIVVAKFEADGHWYRARVIESDPDMGKVKVFYVDYGNTELVAERDIRSMDQRFLHVPFQALECFLPLDPIEGETWTEEAKLAFRSMADGKYLFAHILARSPNGLLTLELYDTEEEEIDLTAWLVDNHLARRATTDHVHSFRKFPSRHSLSVTSSGSNTSIHFIPG